MSQCIAEPASRPVKETSWGCVDVQPATLRKLLGTYPTGVAIVTTRAPDGRPVGLTINSFASLSLDPPLVLWSLVNQSPSLLAFRDCTHFAINVLASDHESLARRFASAAVPDKFADVAWQTAPEGVPTIDESIATLVCAHDHSRDTGDHFLFVGRVVRTASREGAPLVFHSGRFTSLGASL